MDKTKFQAFQMVFLVFLLCLLPATQCTAPTLYVDVLSPNAGNGAESTPFSSLDSAFTAALSHPSVSISVLPTSSIVDMTGSYDLHSNLTLVGNAVVIQSSGEITLHSDGVLTVHNATLKDMVVRSEGVLGWYDVTGVGNVSIRVNSGEAEVRNSRFLDTGSVFLVNNSEVWVQICDSEFTHMTGDMLTLHPDSPTTALTRVEVTNVTIRFLTGYIVNYLSVPVNFLTISLSNSVLRDTAGGLFTGDIVNSNITLESVTIQNMTEVINTSVYESFIRINGSEFDTIVSRFILCPVLTGHISIANSTMRHIATGPLFLITSLSPGTGVVTLDSSSISYVLNPSSQFTSIIIYAISTTVLISNLDISNCTVLSNGLLLLTASVGVLSNLHYHDSSVEISSILTCIASTLRLTNVLIERVENNAGAVMANLITTNGHWDNVTVLNSIDRKIGALEDFIVLWVGYSSVFTLKNCYFRNPGNSLLAMATTSNAIVSVENTVFADGSWQRVFDVFTNGSFVMENVTFERISTNLLLNCFQSEMCWKGRNIQIKEPKNVNYLGYVSRSGVEVSDSVFSGLTTDLFHSISGRLLLSNLTLLNCTTSVLHQAFEGSLTIRDLTMSNCRGSFLFRASYIQCSLSNLRLFDLNYNKLFSFTSVTVSISHSALTTNQVNAYGGLGSFQSSQVTLTNTQFSHISGQISTSYGFFTLQNSLFTLISCAFSYFNSTLIDSTESNVTLYGSEFTNGGFSTSTTVYIGKTYGAVLHDVNSVQISVDLCSFSLLNAQFGGVFSHFGKENECKMRHFYRKNEFEGCSGGLGGAIYGLYVSLKVENSRFRGNKADFGGVLWSKGTKKCHEVVLNECNLTGNTGNYEGGGVKYINSDLIVRNTSFSGNWGVYGADIAGEIASIAVIDAESEGGRGNYTVEVGSGQRLEEEVVIGVFDERGQVIVSDNTSQLVLGRKDGKEGLTGSVVLYPEMGRYRPSNLILTGEIGTWVDINATIGSISNTILSVRLRDCLPGEYRNASMCMVCTNNMYSLDPSIPCKLCPAEAVCTEGYQMKLQQGYWRSSAYTDRIYTCIIPELCLGGLNSTCTSGHYGPMCNSCQTDYFKGSQLQCVPCKGPVLSAFKSTAALLISMGIFIVAVRNKYKRALVCTTLFNYFNTVRILANLNIFWPDSLLYTLTVLGDIGSLGLTAFTDLCLGSISTVESIYSQSVMSLIYFLSLSISLFLLSFLLFSLSKRRMVYKKPAEIALYGGYGMLPMLFMRMCQLLSCYEVDGVHVMVYSPQEECWTDRHARYVYGVGIPVLVGIVAVGSGMMAVGYAKRKDLVRYMGVTLLGNVALTGVLVMSNALELPGQVGIVVLVEIGMDLLLIASYRTLGYQVTQTAATGSI